jgi:hypothetical protein
MDDIWEIYSRAWNIVAQRCSGAYLYIDISTLRGKAQWALCLGTAGRAALQPLAERQNAGMRPDEGLQIAGAIDAGWGWAVTPALRSVLGFLRDLMAGDLPDFAMRLDSDADRPIVILSDAMWRPGRPEEERPNGFGRVAYLAWVPERMGGGRLVLADAEAPEGTLKGFARLRKKKKQYICDLEEVGIAAPYFAPELGEVLKGRHVIHFAGNKGSEFGRRARLLVVAGNGTGHQRDAHVLGTVGHPSVGGVGVKSEANLSDLPSLSEYGWAGSLGAEEIPFTFPPCGEWDEGVSAP